jgi:hypothetical protein
MAAVCFAAQQPLGHDAPAAVGRADEEHVHADTAWGRTSSAIRSSTPARSA